jgi:hypothetical protein
MSNLYRVLYCSRNMVSGGAAEMAANIREILAASRRNNARDDVTGWLLFSAGCFAQVLEGPKDAVEAAFERIQCDERHNEITVLQSGPIEARDFPDWSMAFSGSAAENAELASVVLNGAFSCRTKAGNAVLAMLKGLVDNEEDWLVSGNPAGRLSA